MSHMCIDFFYEILIDVWQRNFLQYRSGLSEPLEFFFDLVINLLVLSLIILSDQNSLCDFSFLFFSDCDHIMISLHSGMWLRFSLVLARHIRVEDQILIGYVIRVEVAGVGAA